MTGPRQMALTLLNGTRLVLLVIPPDLATDQAVWALHRTVEPGSNMLGPLQISAASAQHKRDTTVITESRTTGTIVQEEDGEGPGPSAIGVATTSMGPTYSGRRSAAWGPRRWPRRAWGEGGDAMATDPKPANGKARGDSAPSSETAPERGAPRLTRASAAGVGTATALLLLILLIVFMLQNTRRVEVHFLGLAGSLPLGMALLIAAVGGGVVVATAGVARITQLRMNARQTRRHDSGRDASHTP